MRRFLIFLLLLTFMLPVLALGEEGDVYRDNLIPEPSDITPAYRSEYHPEHEGCYWCTPMDITDEAAVWAMLTAPMTVVDIDQMKQTEIYAEPDENSKKIGVVTGQSQALHVLEKMDNGWTKVETYSTSFFDSSVKNYNAFVTGYIRSNMLKTVTPNQNYGIVVDKLTQRLYLFKDGHLETCLVVSTGLYNKSQPWNETRSGEYLIIYTKTGELKDGKTVSKYALRFNQADYLHQVCYDKRGEDEKDFTPYEPYLGQRKSHGCIRVQRVLNAQGYTMAKLADLIKNRTDKNCVKLVIWEDYQGRQIQTPSDDALLYYNPKGGQYYHASSGHEGNIKKSLWPLPSFTYGELDEEPYSKLKPCPYCHPLPRENEIEEINQIHMESSPGEVMSYHTGK